jgi:hypothetical protein
MYVVSVYTWPRDLLRWTLTVGCTLPKEGEKESCVVQGDGACLQIGTD